MADRRKSTATPDGKKWSWPFSSKEDGEKTQLIKKEDEETAENTDAKLKGSQLPRTLFQKFLFLVLTTLQCVVVYMVYYSDDFGLPVFKPSGGPLKTQYAVLILTSCILAYVSFFISAFSEAFGGFVTIQFYLAISLASITTALINAIGSRDWGASGDIITLLKYLIQYQAFISYIDVGFLAAWQIPNVVIPDFVTPVVKFFKEIDKHINRMLEPIVWAGQQVLLTLTYPFVLLFMLLCEIGKVFMRVVKFIFKTIFSMYEPLQTVVASAIVKMGELYSLFVDLLKWSFLFFVHTLLAMCTGIRIVLEWICQVLYYICLYCIVWPIQFMWNYLVVWPLHNIILASVIFLRDRLYDFFVFLGDNTPCGPPIKKFLGKWHKLFCQDDDFGIAVTETGVMAVDADGYFQKRGVHAYIWNQRYYILKEGVLTYYTQGDQGRFAGQIQRGCLELWKYSHASINSGFEIILASSDRSVKEYVLKFERVATRDKFCSNLNAHIAYAAEKRRLEMEPPRAMQRT